MRTEDINNDAFYLIKKRSKCLGINKYVNWSASEVYN